MNKAKSMTGAAFLAISLIVAGCTSKPPDISVKGFDPRTAPLCRVANGTAEKIMLKVIAGPPSADSGTYFVYPKGQSSDMTLLFCGSKVEIYASGSTKPIATVTFNKNSVIGGIKQKPAASGV
jgi:hypothetical protein